MIKTIILSGTEQKVEFSGNHTHYWIQNLSDSDVLASMSSGITEGADNVLTIPAGGVSYVRDDKGASSVYLLGTGKVQIYGKSNELCPFKTASGGGDSGGSGRVIDAQTVNGHTVESDVPENAVFTDTTYSLSASYKTITLTDSEGNTSNVEVVRAERFGRVAAGETATILSSLNTNQKPELKLLAAYDPSNGSHEYVWFDGNLTAIGTSSVSGFTVSTSYGYTTVYYTAPSSGVACGVYVFHFIKYY